MIYGLLKLRMITSWHKTRRSCRACQRTVGFGWLVLVGGRVYLPRRTHGNRPLVKNSGLREDGMFSFLEFWKLFEVILY